jgi:hypothetical protein
LSITPWRYPAELGLLIGLCAVLLDGLNDAAPEELSRIRDCLKRTLVLADPAPPGWPARGRPDATITARASGTDHPVALLLAWAAAELAGRVCAQPGWCADDAVRRRFRRAMTAAYIARLGADDRGFGDPGLGEPGSSSPRPRRAWVDRACGRVFAGALVPFVVHGWPARQPSDGFTTTAYAIGEYVGWLEAAADVPEDPRAEQWNALAEAVVARLRAVRRDLAAIGLPEAHILATLADATGTYPAASG